ncbi:substrate-binding domain-containing protein [Conexibacter sp. S30A1]|uniref:substrate-binding domain-containing protein n=1 Tax=Conexibacter sp. S30A1 TaxID=2937800 RepID=UPI00200EAAC8|nr:substrate-binding domain-containing protein [Conexibacter sp. S30A1]
MAVLRPSRFTAFSMVAFAASLATAVSSSAAHGSAMPNASAASAGHTPACVPHVPTSLPRDPNHVASKLTGAARAGIGGYPGTVYASPWAHFKPKAKPPWVIGMSNNEGNLNAADVLKGLREEARLNPGLVKKIIVTTPSTPNDVPQQIQQMRSLIEQHVNFIISTLGSPTALNAVINQAAARGIPTISLLGQSTSKNAVNLQPNPIQLGYYGARGLLTAMGTGTGTVLNVAGIPGLSINTDIEKGANEVFRACKTPIVGNLTGDFSPTVAKTQVLTFLSAHPGTIDGVFQVADMAPGIFSAFQQVGRKVPPVADIGAPASSLVYWKQHISSGYHGSGVAIPAIKDGTYSMAVALAMLQGDGVKITDVPFAPPVITPGNLNKWIEKGWTQSTNALGDGPPSAVPITALLDTYFNKKPTIKSAG